MNRNHQRIARIGLGFGLIFTGLLIRQIGLRDVAHYISLIGSGLLSILFISFLWKWNNALAWWSVFSPDENGNRPPIRKLFIANSASDVFNNMLPSAGLGGEFAKPYFLQSWTPIAHSFSAILINKFCEILSGVIFTVFGLCVALRTLPLPEPIRSGMTIIIGLIGAILPALFWVRTRNLLLRLCKSLYRTPIVWRFLHTRSDVIHQIYRNSSSFGTHHKTRLLGCVMLHLLSWCLGTYEAFLILHLMGVKTMLSTALLLAVLPMIIDLIFFFVPLNLGTSEAGHTYVAMLLGLAPAVGLSVSLIKRIRKLCWMVTGVVLLYVVSRMPDLDPSEDGGVLIQSQPEVSLQPSDGCLLHLNDCL